jgi:multiple sugar transport system substrate-binding protein
MRNRRFGFVLLVIMVVILLSVNLLAAPAKVKVKFPNWMFTEPGVKELFFEGIADFERKHPNIKVVTIAIPPGQYEDKLLTEISAGIVPDVFPVFTNMLPKLINLDILEPLDAMLKKEAFAKNLVKLQNASVKNGKTYGVVLTASPQGLIYNKKLLNAAGVKAIPQTPEELFTAAQKIKQKTAAFGFAFTNSSNDPLFMYIYAMQWVLGFGSDFTNPKGQPTINSPKTVEAIKWMKKFSDADLIPKGIDTITMRRMFWDEKIGMMIDGPWTMTHIYAELPDKYPDFGFTLSPTPTHAAITGGAFYTIPRKAKYKKEAWEIIAYFNTEQFQRKWLEQTMQIPAQPITPTAAFMKKHPWVRNMNEIAKKYGAGFGYAPPGQEVYANEFRKMVTDHLGDIWSGKKSVDEALNEAQKEVEQWLKDKSTDY